ncbi:MAG: LamG domain-containing protein [Candidatus Aenigmatarchaeota archaeon]
MQSKAISAVIATVMLLMITVSLVGVFYVFSSTMASQTTSSGSEQASQLTAQLSMCMQVDNIIGNQITLRNCGKGVIENKSLVVMIDDVALDASTNTIMEGNSSVVNVSGLWQVPFGKHSLKITNGAAVALALVEIIPNPDGLAGSWNFDEGTGAITYDNSGNGNVGALTNMNTTGNATSGWAEGRFREGLQFDGANDYVNAGNAASLNITNAITVSVWVKTNKSNIDIMNKALPAGNQRSWGLQIDSSGLAKMGFSATGTTWDKYITGTTNISDNIWKNIIAAYDGTVINLYVNGVVDKTPVPYSSGLYASNASLKIGASYFVAYFNGTIDEVRIWSKAFAPDDTVVMKQII